jgi:hypothetical protein
MNVLNLAKGQGRITKDRETAGKREVFDLIALSFFS